MCDSPQKNRLRTNPNTPAARAVFASMAVLIWLAALVAPSSLEARTLKDRLSGTFTPDDLKTVILAAKEWEPFPRAGGDWGAVSEDIRSAHISAAEALLGCDWVTPKASVFLEYVRDGNRSRYQAVSFRRRTKLAALVLGECMEGKGRFLDDILNGVWTICEETYWGVPAHVGAQKRGSGLPDVTEPTVDLFAAETGMLLAWTDYLVGEGLDGISPLIRERIATEVKRRILDVCLERDDFWWMGFGGRTVNNWNPWICSNWLTTVLILEKDETRRANSIHKIFRCLDNFLNPYPADGGCDEGPSYWGRAGGSLYDCLELLHSASEGKIDLFADPLIQNMGRFITRAHIAGNWFINFADAPARMTPDPSLVFRFGKAIGDGNMEAFGAWLAGRRDWRGQAVLGSFGSLGRTLPTLFILNELLAAEGRAPLQRDFWLPELQVMGARSAAGKTDGFYVAAKGGHNAESHNHNDVGNFVVYADGRPVIIDAGVETYTAKTFSSRRYEIWTMQSAYHNLPTVNGVMQKEGGAFAARDVEYASDDRKAVLSLDIAGAYPPEARLKSWRRTITLRRGRSVEIRDGYSLEELREPLLITLMTRAKPEITGPGRIRLVPPGESPGDSPVYILFDGKRFSAAVEPVALEDDRLRSSWGNVLYRILLTSNKPKKKDTFTVRITRDPSGK
jgi:hypothetical protein